MSLLQGTEKQDEHGIKRKRVSQKQFSRRELVDEGARENVFACRFTFGTGLLFLQFCFGIRSTKVTSFGV